MTMLYPSLINNEVRYKGTALYMYLLLTLFKVPEPVIQTGKECATKNSHRTNKHIWAFYSKCSKLSNTRCLPKRPRQIIQTDQGFSCLLFCPAFCEFQP